MDSWSRTSKYHKWLGKVERWFQVEYPAIQKQARKDKATIHWCDEMGLRSDNNVGRTYERILAMVAGKLINKGLSAEEWRRLRIEYST